EVSTTPDSPNKDVILVVEDDTNLRTLYVNALMAKGFLVVSAGNGKDALALFQRNPVRLLLTDLMLPGMDGFELVEKVGGEANGKNIKIIAMSAVFRDFKVRREKLERFNVDFLLKPFPLPELFAKVGAPRPAKQKEPEKPAPAAALPTSPPKPKAMK